MAPANQNVSEEILLSSPEATDIYPDAEKFKIITGQLHQDSKWKMQRKLFRIHYDKFLSVKEHTLTSKKNYWFPLAHLNPEPVRQRRINWKLVIGAVISCQIVILLLYMRISLNLGDWTRYTTIPTILLFASTLILTGLSIFTSSNNYVFHSRKGHYPIAIVLNNLPSKQEFKQFITKLSQCIERAEQDLFGDESQRLAAEVSQLRRLRDEKAISNEAYISAKDTIFSHY